MSSTGSCYVLSSLSIIITKKYLFIKLLLLLLLIFDCYDAFIIHQRRPPNNNINNNNNKPIQRTTSTKEKFASFFVIYNTVDVTTTTITTRTRTYTAPIGSTTKLYATSTDDEIHYGSDNDNDDNIVTMKRVPTELEGIPIPFIDTTISTTSSSGNTLQFIECYIDSICTIHGITYTIGVPCDYSVAICKSNYDDDGDLTPIDITDTKLMDDIFPVIENIILDEFDEELVLQRTPQTLTLVGELEEDDDDEDEDDDDDEDDDEEVEVLLSFEHRDEEYHLVRLLDPILLVGKEPTVDDDDNNDMDTRILLTPEESDQVMPLLEKVFLQYSLNSDDDDDDNDDYFPDDFTLEP